MSGLEKKQGYANVQHWEVLIIDDIPDNLVVAQAALTFHGARVYTAGNAVDALTLLQKIQPTVILVDLRMPTIDGWELSRRIRQNPRTCHIPLIALTAYTVQNELDLNPDIHFDSYIRKPYNVTNLIAEIQRVLP